jgi:SAM-dependent methyltransferase
MWYALQGDWPARYASNVREPYEPPFNAAVRPLLRPGLTVLDVGSGWRPAIPASARPAGCTYVGLDISAGELERAGDVYDESIVADITRFDTRHEARFDLVVSRFLLEHVAPIDAALESMRLALKPGGHLVSLVPGRFAPFAVANQILPAAVTRRLLKRTAYRDPTLLFPAVYDRCWHSALVELLAGWSAAHVEPLYTSAYYLRFSKLLQSMYLGVEEMLIRLGRRNLASHYVLTATR